ncbi:MAG: cysteine desulfurase family protein [Nitrospinales bacterium]
MENIYLDNNATTPVAPEALDAMIPLLKDTFGNPSSIHSHGRAARVLLDQAREQVGKLINAHPGEIVFTSGGTESINFAIFGVAQALKGKGQHIITSVVEHPAVLNTCHQLMDLGFKVDFLSVDTHGRIDVDNLRSLITDETILISIQHANSEVGVLQPIDLIADIAKERGILFHSDMVQSVGKLPLDVKKLSIDLVSFSSHKMYGPKGVGVLYIKKGTPKLFSLISGGGQERNRRGGTENIPGIVGLGIVAEMARKRMESDISHIEEMRNHLESLITEQLSGAELFTDDSGARLPNTISVGFDGIDGQTLMIRLDIEGISVSTGTACGSGSISPSEVLSAMNVPLEKIRGMIRISLGRNNTLLQVNRFFKILKKLVLECRKTASVA